MSTAAAAVEQLAHIISESDTDVALNRAGNSEPAGIPDFRSPGTGVWEHVNPIEVAHIDAFRRDPERFWLFYGARFEALEHKRPNRAHERLAELEQAGMLDAVITQNIDQLHARAGTTELVEVHGTIAHSSCLVCRSTYPLADVRERQDLRADGVPRCECGQPLKPDVVLFGEYLPETALARAEELAAGADLLLCIGSSLEVYPVGQLPAVTLGAGGQIAILTQGATPLDSRATVRLGGDIVDELSAVCVALGV